MTSDNPTKNLLPHRRIRDLNIVIATLEGVQDRVAELAGELEERVNALKLDRAKLLAEQDEELP